MTWSSIMVERGSGNRSGRWVFSLVIFVTATMLFTAPPRLHEGSGPSHPGAGIFPEHSADPATALAQEIEALVDIVAGKYRVSKATLRELVHTAYREGTRLGVDPLLVIAVMAVESGFDPKARSRAGALGLMQVIPRFHADKFDAAGGETILDPQTNITVGVKVLKEYIARDGNQAAGLQRYNGARNDPNQAYAKKVLREQQWLKQAIRPDARA